jgi:hypothetical protein
MAAAGGGRRRWQGAEPIRRAGGADERTALVPAAAMGMGGVAVAKESAEEQAEQAKVEDVGSSAPFVVVAVRFWEESLAQWQAPLSSSLLSADSTKKVISWSGSL